MARKAEKRSRSSDDAPSVGAAASTSSEKASAARVAAANTTTPTTGNKSKKTTTTPTKKRRSHTVEGKLERSADTLASLAEKKTEQDIWAGVVPSVRKTKDSDYDPKTMLKLVSWNVAGLRGLLKRNAAALQDFVSFAQPDVLCLQETKLNVADAAQNAQLGLLEGYTFVDHPCQACKGYSGTRTYCREATVMSTYRARSSGGFALPAEYASREEAESNNNKKKTTTMISETPEAMPLVEDVEGRVLTTLLAPAQGKTNSSTGTAATTASHAGKDEDWRPRLAIVNTYIPNSGMGLDRLPYRTELFDARMRAFLKQLDHLCTGAHHKKSDEEEETRSDSKGNDKRPGGFIWTGDLNVAERDFDRYFSGTYRTMQDVSGFTPEERSSFRQTLAETKAVDAFRILYPQSGPTYTFWSARIHGREKNLGWRLDYFVVSAALAPHVVDCFPMPEVRGSDHCPVQLWLRKL